MVLADNKMTVRAVVAVVVIAATMLLLGGCGGKNEPEPVAGPKVISVEALDVRYHDARLKATFSGLQGDAICGFEVSAAEAPAATKAGTAAEAPAATKAGTAAKAPAATKAGAAAEVKEYTVSPEDGTITYKIEGLSEDSEYSFRAFADNGRGLRTWSEMRSFRTARIPGPDEVVVIEDNELKKWLLSRYDSNSDGELSYAEAQGVGGIEMCSDNVLSTKGLEYLSELRELFICGSYNDSGGWNGKLTEIDLSGNTKLRKLLVYNNMIRHLDLDALTEISHLEVSRNPLEEISFASQKKATLIACSNTSIKECDLSGLNYLDEMHLDDNHKLESVKLDNQKLRYIDLSNCALKTLDLSGCPLLNVVTTIGNVELKTIKISRKQSISTLVKEPNTQIEYVD